MRQHDDATANFLGRVDVIGDTMGIALNAIHSFSKFEQHLRKAFYGVSESRFRPSP